MMYVNEQMIEQLVQDRHASVAGLYARDRRPGIVAGFGSMLIRIGEWLRRDLELPGMPASADPKFRPGGC